jgi:DNA-binding IclR family transcriptional regulator
MARNVAIDTVSTYYGTLQAHRLSEDTGSSAVLDILRRQNSRGFPAEQIADEAELSQAKVERVLAHLTESGLVEASGRASTRRFSLTPEAQLLSKSD